MPTAPVDTPISGLPSNPGVTASDVVEVLDTSNTTNFPTGENTKATVASLVAGLPAFVASGAGHAAGLVPDPGATGGTSRFLREDATFAVPAGGSGGVPGGSTGQVQYNNAGAFGGLASVPVANGGTGLTALGTALQVLRVNAGATGLEYASVSGGGGTPGGTNGQIQFNNAGAFGGVDLTTLMDTMVGGAPVQGSVAFRDSTGWNDLGPGTSGQFLKTQGAGANPVWAAASGGGTRTPLFAVNTIGNQVTGVTPASLFQSPFTATGTRTIPANRLVAGSQIMGMFFGDLYIVTGDTMTVTIKLGSTTILTGVTSGATGTVTGNMWMIRDFMQSVLTGGATAGTRGNATVSASTTAPGTLITGFLSTAGGGQGSVSAVVDATGTLLFDILVSFSSANAANLCRILGGALFIDG